MVSTFATFHRVEQHHSIEQPVEVAAGKIERSPTDSKLAAEIAAANTKFV